MSERLHTLGVMAAIIYAAREQSEVNKGDDVTYTDAAVAAHDLLITVAEVSGISAGHGELIGP